MVRHECRVIAFHSPTGLEGMSIQLGELLEGLGVVKGFGSDSGVSRILAAHFCSDTKFRTPEVPPYL